MKERTSPCVLPWTETKKIEGEIDWLKVVGRVGDTKISLGPSSTEDAYWGFTEDAERMFKHRASSVDKSISNGHFVSESL